MAGRLDRTGMEGRGGGCERGFTLMEILIVVAIIGLLLAIAIPSFQRATEKTRIAQFAGDLRVASAAFELYALDNGSYPGDVSRGVVPPGMETYLFRMNWTLDTPLGGRWDWDCEVCGVRASVSVAGSPASVEQMQKADELADDGDLTTGAFRRHSGSRYLYVLEELPAAEEEEL